MKNRLLFSLTIVCTFVHANLQSMSGSGSQGSAAYLSAMSSVKPVAKPAPATGIAQPIQAPTSNVEASNAVHMLGEPRESSGSSVSGKRDEDNAKKKPKLRPSSFQKKQDALRAKASTPANPLVAPPAVELAPAKAQDSTIELDASQVTNTDMIRSKFSEYSKYIQGQRAELAAFIAAAPTKDSQSATAAAEAPAQQTTPVNPPKEKKKNEKENKESPKPSFTPNISKALSMYALKNCPIRLKQAVSSFQRGKNFKSYKRFLLVGPSGSGKSTIAEAIAGEYGIPLLFHRGSFIANTYQNSGDQNIKAIFEEAIAKQPCILVIDELNALFEKYERTQDSDKGMLIALWSMIDECAKHKVLFVGTLNYIKKLPPQIATRFPGIIKIDLPGEDERAAAMNFFTIHQYMANYVKFNAIDLKKIAQKTYSFSLRDIEALTDLVSMIADANNDTKDKPAMVNTEDILELIPEILERKYDVIDKTTDEWKEYAKTALQYGFQVATFAGQMAFQKWMQDQQFKHADASQDQQFKFSEKAQKEQFEHADAAQAAQFIHGEMLHKDGKAHQANLAQEQNSASNVAKNSAISALASGSVSALTTVLTTKAIVAAQAYCTIQ